MIWLNSEKMFTLRNIFFCILVVFLCSGCAKWLGTIGYDANLSAEMDKAVNDLVNRTEQPLDRSQPIMVGTIVDIDSFERSTTLGRTLSQLITSHLVQLGFLVHEITIRHSLYIKKEGGEFILSRDIKALSLKYQAQAVVVGTYSIAKNTVQVNLHLVDSSDSVIISSSDLLLPLGSETRALLQH